MPYHKQVDKRLAEVQKTVVLATTAALRNADELLLAKKNSRLPDTRGVIGLTVDAVTLLVKSHRQMSGERKSG